MLTMKPVVFRGTSLDDLRAFPSTARREAGLQLDQVQRGLDADDWKPMTTVGQGVKEIRIRDASGAFRVIYVLCSCCIVFRRRQRQTSKADVALATKRYRELLRELNR